MSLLDTILYYLSPDGPFSGTQLGPPGYQDMPKAQPPAGGWQMHDPGQVTPRGHPGYGGGPMPQAQGLPPHQPAPTMNPPAPPAPPAPWSPEMTGQPPVPGHPGFGMLDKVGPGPEFAPLGPGESPAGPESWQFPMPSTGSIDLNAVQRAQDVADIEAATANNWGRGPSGGPPPGPMEQYLNSYDERTNAIVEKMQQADQANKLLEMGAGVFDAGIGNYTGAMGNVFKTQANYNTKPGAYEAFRGERDSGKLDDLYKIAQARKATQGNQPQLSAKDQLAMQFMDSPEEFRAYLGVGPQFKQKQFADGTGAFFMDDATGEFYIPTRPDEVFNMNTPDGRKAYAEAEAVAISMQPDRLKAAEKSETARGAWDTLVKYMGEEAASLLGSKPADQERIMQLALANVYAMQQMPMPDNIDVEMAWQTILNDPKLTDADKQQIAEMVRRSVGQ